jgi:hypothetical protein
MRNLDLSSVGYKIGSREDLQNHIPAAFAVNPHPDRTERYSFVSTIDLLDTFEKLGWIAYSAKQHGKNIYGRHIIRLSNQDLGFLALKGDKVKPHILLDNSHDGYTPASLHLGLFRLVCENGLVIAMPGMSTQIKFRHINVDRAELMQILSEAAEQYRTIGLHIGDMQSRVLTNEEREEFAIRAVSIREPKRFINPDGTINLSTLTNSLNPKALLEAVRPQDGSNDLWTTFNLIQERTMKGMYERKGTTGRKSSPREITNAARALDFNKEIWSIAEEYLGSTTDALTTSEKKTYTAKSGNKMEVEVLQKMDQDHFQVKSANGLVFTANVAQLS